MTTKIIQIPAQQNVEILATTGPPGPPGPPGSSGGDVTAHLDDTTDAHDASAISVAPTGTIAATNVQSALAELDTEKETPAGAQTKANAAQAAAEATANAALNSHLSDATDAHDASAISTVPAGTLAATNVQSALNELDTEKETPAGAQAKADVVNTALNNHISDSTDAHDASAISVVATGNISSTDVQSALAELDSEKETPAGAQAKADTVNTALNAHLSDSVDAHDASAISVSPSGTISATDVQAALVELDSEKETPAGAQAKADAVNTALTNHMNDATDAHDASAISVVPTGAISSTTVQAALAELDTEKATTGSVTTVSTDLSNHLADSTDAHDASAISFAPVGTIAATDAQTAIAEVATDAATALSGHTGAGTGAHAATAISYAGSTNLSSTNVEAALDELDSEKASTGSVTTVANDLAAHLADTTDAHDASAISFSPTGTIAATDVQAAIAEVAAEAGSGSSTTIAIVTASGTTYTLVLTDAGKMVETTNASAVTVTVPTNASVAFPVGTILEIRQAGVGQVTVSPAGGVTIRSAATYTTRAQWSGISLHKRGTDEWVIAGDLT